MLNINLIIISTYPRQINLQHLQHKTQLPQSTIQSMYQSTQTRLQHGLKKQETEHGSNARTRACAFQHGHATVLSATQSRNDILTF